MRTTHTARLHREAVLTLSMEDLSNELGIDVNLQPRHKTFETTSKIGGRQITRFDKVGAEPEELFSFAVRVRWLEEHSSNYPGCGNFLMLDLDKKVANRVCANTKGGNEVIKLENNKDRKKPYHVEIRTGCKNEPKRRDRFCEVCMSNFSVDAKDKDSICFFQSLHPLGCKKRKLTIGEARLVERNVDKQVLVKQFGVTYKFLMREDDLPVSAKERLQK